MPRWSADSSSTNPAVVPAHRKACTMATSTGTTTRSPRRLGPSQCTRVSASGVAASRRLWLIGVRSRDAETGTLTCRVVALLGTQSPWCAAALTHASRPPTRHARSTSTFAADEAYHPLRTRVMVRDWTVARRYPALNPAFNSSPADAIPPRRSISVSIRLTRRASIAIVPSVGQSSGPWRTGAQLAPRKEESSPNGCAGVRCPQSHSHWQKRRFGMQLLHNR